MLHLLPFCLLTLNQGDVSALTLATNGNTDYGIVVAADAIPPERTAARELHDYLQKVTGADFPLESTRDARPVAKKIVVGPNALFHAAAPDVDLKSLGRDGIVMRTVGDVLFLAGGRPRGTLYAVYTFLEDVVGVRWWSSTESFLPKTPTLTIPTLNRVYVPKLHYREAFYRDVFNGVFAARLKCNGHFERIPPEYGGHYTILGWCHTFYQLIPPDKYFAAHPDWFSERHGKRTAERAQLCLTNEEVRREVIENALGWLRENPDAGMISIAQNDWGGRCRCDKCKALEDEEGSPSGPLLHFVNAVAAGIEKEFPDTLVETLAYNYTRHAPKHVRPRRNVIVRLCSIECSFSQPLATGPQNKKFREDMEAWSAIAPQLYVWNYVTNFRNSILPHPNLRVLAPNIRFFVAHHAIGLFEQGDAYSRCGDFVELRAWLLAHLMWDPSRNEHKLVTEFLRGYYGPAAAPLQAYLDLVNDAAEESGIHLGCSMRDTSGWFKLDQVVEADKLFDRAEELVGNDPVLLRRVQRARMPLDNVWLKRYTGLRSAALREGIPFPGPNDMAAFARRFIARAHEFDVGQYREGRSFSEYEAHLRSRFLRPPGPPPKECAGLPEEDWMDVQDDEFQLFGEGKWVEIVDDPAASDGKAAKLTTNHTQWAIQVPVSADFQGLGRLHCYLVARCEAKATAGPAFVVGIYDTRRRKYVMQTEVSVQQSAGAEYRTLDLGVHELEPGMHFWVAPVNNPGRVTAVFVDRLFWLKEKE